MSLDAWRMVTPTYDEIMFNPNCMLAHYLMSCYAYYVLGTPVYSDAQFDGLAQRLLAQWDDVTHPHKHLISKGDLRAGTGFSIKYTNMIKGATVSWIEATLHEPPR